MPKKLLEITATAGRMRWHSDDEDEPVVIMEGSYANGDSRASTIILKGKADGDDPRQHLSYRFYGQWREYEYRGQTERQFWFTTFVKATPHTRAGIITYLDGAPGIGRTLAGRLFDKFAGDAVKILREQPEVAAAACERLSVEAAMQASEWLKREQALEDCSIELVDLLAGRGFPKSLPKTLTKKYGNRAGQIVKADPFKLMQERRCGFKRADALYLDLGLPPGALKRQAYCATYHAAQQTAQSGDTWVFRKVVDIGLAGAIGGADVRADRAIELASRGGIMSIERTASVDGPPDWDGAFMWVADARKARSEQRLAMYVCEALSEGAEP